MLQMQGPADLPLYPGGASYFDNGDVGIGTNLPTATLSVNGTANKPGGGSWTVFSDERLKDVHGHFSKGLNEILQLDPIYYSYKDDNPMDLPSEPEHVGFIAQEVKKAIPEAVSENHRGFFELNADPILWSMVNAIKELFKKFKLEEFGQKNLKRKVEKLEKLNKELTNKNNQLYQKYNDLNSRLKKLEEKLSSKP